MTPGAANLSRSGVLARKCGMTRLWDGNGDPVPVTVLELAGCQVVGVRTQERDGYCAVQLGSGVRKSKNSNKAQRNVYERLSLELKAVVAEFRVSEDMLLPVGALLAADHFVVGQKVDVQGRTKGKGFAGAMKRWNFGGLRASHGVSLSHRAHGSTGQRQDPGKTFRGKKMAGHLGDAVRTQQNLTVIDVRPETGLILIKGSVAGAEGAWVKIRDAVKQPLPSEAPRPGRFRLPNYVPPPWAFDLTPAELEPDSIADALSSAWEDIERPGESDARARAAYLIYRGAFGILSPGYPAAFRRSAQVERMVRALPEVAFFMMLDDAREVARAGALLTAVTLAGATPETDLPSSAEVWPDRLIPAVAARLQAQVASRRLQLLVVPDLKRSEDGARMTGKVSVLDRFPALDLGGPVRTRTPGWFRPDMHLTLSALTQGADGSRPVEISTRPHKISRADVIRGTLAALDVDFKMPEGEVDGFSLRPMLGHHPLDPISIDA